MKNILVGILISLAAGAALAQRAPCDSSSTTRELEVCYTKELNARQAHYDSVFTMVRTSQQGDVQRLLVVADSSWRRYRKAECDAQVSRVAQGSIRGVTRILCRLTLLDDRIRTLESSYDESKGGSEKPSN